MMLKGSFSAEKPRAGSRTIVAAVPRAAHPIPVAALLLSPAHHARRRGLVRAVAVSPNFTFLVVSARVGLVGKRKVYSEALLCTRNGCTPFKKAKKPKQSNKRQDNQLPLKPPK